MQPLNASPEQDSNESRTALDQLSPQIKAARQDLEISTTQNSKVGHLLENFRDYLELLASRELSAGLRPKIAPSDIVQETMIEAFRQFPSFEGQSERDLLAWLRKMLVNNVADAARRFRGASKRDVRRERPMAHPEVVGAAFVDPAL